MPLDEAKAAEVVRALAAGDSRFDWVGIYWVSGQDLVLGPYLGEHPEGHETIRIPEGVCGAVAAKGATEVVPDVRTRPGHIACDVNTRSEVVAAITSDGTVVGFWMSIPTPPTPSDPSRWR